MQPTLRKLEPLHRALLLLGPILSFGKLAASLTIPQDIHERCFRHRFCAMHMCQPAVPQLCCAIKVPYLRRYNRVDSPSMASEHEQLEALNTIRQLQLFDISGKHHHGWKAAAAIGASNSNNNSG